ncbi:hypothetical protein CEE37_00805 [candidate division LCP-89 bacterium B3_LCP]|uniref:Uncharacterized protein n=1 Tax=candidate division LCP-89 bacterium B3_LCP TaxID=2012998 RepID=A0A532V4Y7_UNCL8|nr:MAG: hypothetical protein CEE37_00805 [candidate division LCP-89 bacterium B3_LCP]
MKIIALQDNFSKVQAIEEMTQQMLRFPGEVREALNAQLRQQRLDKRRKINKSKKSKDGNLRTEEKSRMTESPYSRGRKDDSVDSFEDKERQCCIDFKI